MSPNPAYGLDTMKPKALIDRLPFAPHFRRSRVAVLVLRTMCLLHVPQHVLEAYAARGLSHG